MSKTISHVFGVGDNQAMMNFAFEGAQQCFYFMGHFYEENVNLYWNFAKGITGFTAKAQGTMGMKDL